MSIQEEDSSCDFTIGLDESIICDINSPFSTQKSNLIDSYEKFGDNSLSQINFISNSQNSQDLGENKMSQINDCISNSQTSQNTSFNNKSFYKDSIRNICNLFLLVLCFSLLFFFIWHIICNTKKEISANEKKIIEKKREIENLRIIIDKINEEFVGGKIHNNNLASIQNGAKIIFAENFEHQSPFDFAFRVCEIEVIFYLM
jgi:hypothetical protein